MREKSLKSNIIFNTLRTGLNIIFPLVTFPYISRVLDADGVGKYDFSKSIISYFILLAGLGISQYAIREGAAIRNDNNKLTQFSNQMFTINLISTGVSYLLLFSTLFFFDFFEDYKTLILIFSIQIISVTLSIEWLYTILEDFKFITIRSFIVQLISLILMFIFVKGQNDYIIYAWITTLSLVGAYVFNFIYIQKKIKLRITANIQLKKHLKPILILFSNTIASTIYLSSDITLIGIISGDYYVGIYSVAVKIYTIVKSLTNAALSSAIPRLSNYYNQGEISKYNDLLNSLFWSMLTLIMPSIVGILVLSKEIVLIIAGDSFLRSSVSLSILSIGLLFSIIAAFLIHGVLLIQRNEKIILKATSIAAVFNIVANLLTVPYFNEVGSAVSTVFAELIIVIIAYRYGKNNFTIYFDKKKLGAIVLGCGYIIVVCLIMKTLFSSILAITVFSVILSMIGYYIILWRFKSLPSF